MEAGEHAEAAPMTAFAIKAEVRDGAAKTFSFAAQKTMYGGKAIAAGEFYRQATDKIAGISENTATFLGRFF
jgi:hypothetical protein